ncbi:dTDP-glucose 4,6-dehydratase 2 [Methylobacterium trifolii]|uniref:dTDP-glucose 4,6-dehydratase 2 n=1 Tax=Methylobacterium trifolii TaxID=1003092 RepID=A0ABQ4U0G6_9HYPH|nr:dTDP-glucose 4,6-dehydratase 2 [Methylobacterium trifolii]
MASRPERVLVTGAAGFVGAWLCRRLLAERCAVAGLVRSPPAGNGLFARLCLADGVDLWIAEETDLSARIRAFAPTAVVNLAGCSQVSVARADPAAAFRANTAFLWELLDALRLLAKPPAFIHASTEAVYGTGTGGGFREGDPTAPLGPYAASKAAGEIVVRSYAATYGLPTVIVRFGNIYGPGDPNHARLVPDLTRSFATDRPVRLRDGRSVRSYLHVDDAVDALLRLVAQAGRPDIRGEVFNVAGERAYTNLDVAQLARAASGRLSADIIVDEALDSTVQFASTEKIRRVLDWQPRISLADGLSGIAQEEATR